MKIILGSSSKPRQQVMNNLGWRYEVMVPDINEQAIRFNDPRELTLALAHAKANALLPKIKEPALLITSDQVVVYNDKIREKPKNVNEARKFLRSYSKNFADCINGLVVINTGTGNRAEGVDVSRVYFDVIPEEIIEKYLNQEHALTHAGAFTVEDPLIKPYVKSIEGSEDSVLGLPINLLNKLIRQVGV